MQVEISTLRSWLFDLAMGLQQEKNELRLADFATGHAYTVKVQRKLDSYPRVRMVSF